MKPVFVGLPSTDIARGADTLEADLLCCGTWGRSSCRSVRINKKQIEEGEVRVRVCSTHCDKHVLLLISFTLLASMADGFSSNPPSLQGSPSRRFESSSGVMGIGSMLSSFEGPIGAGGEAPPSVPSSVSGGGSVYVLDNPTVEAVYPSFFILSWNPPRLASAAARDDDDPSPGSSGKPADASPSPLRAAWKYVVEWRSSYTTTPDVAPASSSTTNATAVSAVTHIVIPMEFSHESYTVRVVARGSILTSVDQVATVIASATCTVPTRRKSHLPWLTLRTSPPSSPSATTSIVIRDALSLCGEPPHCSRDASTMATWCSHSTRRTTPTPVVMGRGTLKHCDFVAIMVVYDNPPPLPLTNAKVVYIVTTPLSSLPSTTSLPRGGCGHEKCAALPVVHGSVLLDSLRNEGTCLVFCGIGHGGVAASRAAHRIIATILSQQNTGNRAAFVKTTRKSSSLLATPTPAVDGSPPSSQHHQQDATQPLTPADDAARRVFCVTFGSPREEFFSAGGLVLSGTAAYSGQFLHYMSCLPSPARSSGFVAVTHSELFHPLPEFVSVDRAASGVNSRGAPDAQGTGVGASSSSSVSADAQVKNSRYLSVPLGIRIGPVLDPVTRKWYLRTVASQFERKSEEEDELLLVHHHHEYRHDGLFDVVGALSILDATVLQPSASPLIRSHIPGDGTPRPRRSELQVSTSAYRAVLVSATATMCSGERGLTVDINIVGDHLHFDPVVVLTYWPSSAASSPLSVTQVQDLVDVTPHVIRCKCSLLDIMTQPVLSMMLSALSRKQPDESSGSVAVPFALSVSNSAGVSNEVELAISLDAMVIRLLGGQTNTERPADGGSTASTAVSGASRARQWMYQEPDALLSTAVSLEPIVASAHSSSLSSFAPYLTTRLLAALEHAADMVVSNQQHQKKRESATSSFFSMVAAKFSSSSSSSTTGQLHPTMGPTSSLSASSTSSPATASHHPQHSLAAAPPRHDAFQNVLQNHISCKKPARHFIGNCSAWRTRVLTTFPWLAGTSAAASAAPTAHDSDAYKRQLLVLNEILALRTITTTTSTSSSPSPACTWSATPLSLQMFQGSSTSATSRAAAHLPLIALEASIVSRVIDWVSSSAGPHSSRSNSTPPTLRFAEPFITKCSFETFHSVIFPLLAASPRTTSSLTTAEVEGTTTHASVSSSSVEILSDAASIWVVCCLFHLRLHYWYMRLVLVCSPCGSGHQQSCGASTVVNVLKLNKDAPSQRSAGDVGNPFLVRRVVRETLDDAWDAVERGLDVRLVVVAELRHLVALAQQDRSASGHNVAPASRWLEHFFALEAAPTGNRHAMVVTKLDESINVAHGASAAAAGATPDRLVRDWESSAVGQARDVLGRLFVSTPPSQLPCSLAAVALKPSAAPIQRVLELMKPPQAASSPSSTLECRVVLDALQAHGDAVLRDLVHAWW